MFASSAPVSALGIAFAERLERDVVIVFTDGKRAQYSASLLHDMIFLANDLTEQPPVDKV